MLMAVMVAFVGPVFALGCALQGARGFLLAVESLEVRQMGPRPRAALLPADVRSRQMQEKLPSAPPPSAQLGSIHVCFGDQASGYGPAYERGTWKDRTHHLAFSRLSTQ